MKKLVIGALLCCPLLPFAQAKRPPDSLVNMPFNRLQQFVNKHPDAEEGFIALKSRYGAFNHSLKDDQPAQVKKIFDSFSARIKKSKDGQAYGELVQKLVNLAPGGETPDFSAPNEDGKMVTLSSFRGKYVLLDFWASWCIPCRKEFPWLKKAYAAYKDKGFEIIGYSIDNEKSLWLSAVDIEDVPWTHLSMLQGPADPIATLFEVHGVPENWLIDPNGKIIAVNLRGEQVAKTLAVLIK